MQLITRLVAWILGIALGLASLLFAIASRDPVTLTIWGIPDQITVPAFVAVLVAWVIGFFVGAIVMWFCHGRSRRLGRAYQSELSQARQEIERLQGEMSGLRKAADDADQARIRAQGAANNNRQRRLLPSRSA